MQSYYVQASTISLAFLGKFIGGVPFNSMRDGVHETFHIFRFFRWYNQQMHKGNLDHSAWRSVSFDQSIWKIFTQLLLMITCSTLMWCLNISIFFRCCCCCCCLFRSTGDSIIAFKHSHNMKVIRIYLGELPRA